MKDLQALPSVGFLNDEGDFIEIPPTTEIADIKALVYVEDAKCYESLSKERKEEIRQYMQESNISLFESLVNDAYSREFGFNKFTQNT